MALDRSLGGMIALITVMLVMSTTSASLRFYARYRQNKCFGLDDYLIIPAWLFFTGLCACGIFGLNRGFIGIPVPDDEQLYDALTLLLFKTYWGAGMLAIFGNGFVRLSALFFFRRIFVTTKKWDTFGIVTFVWIIVVTLWILALAMFQLFECGANIYLTITPIGPVVCSVGQQIETFAISSFLLDISILIMPIPKVWALNIAPMKKVAVSIVFLMAAAGTAASCARMVINIEIISAGVKAAYLDWFLVNTQILFYLILEFGLCLTAVNLPSLRYLFTGDSLENTLRSIRSVTSLRSSGSRRPRVSVSSERQHHDDGSAKHSHDLVIGDDSSSRGTRRDMYEIEISQV